MPLDTTWGTRSRKRGGGSKAPGWSPAATGQRTRAAWSRDPYRTRPSTCRPAASVTSRTDSNGSSDGKAAKSAGRNRRRHVIDRSRGERAGRALRRRGAARQETQELAARGQPPPAQRGGLGRLPHEAEGIAGAEVKTPVKARAEF